MNVLDIKQQIGDLVGVDHTNTTVAARLLRFINNARRELARKHDWFFLKKTYYVQSEKDYTAGTISVTQDTNTVTGSGTSWTSAMAGRFMDLGGVYYKIVSVAGTTSLTLQVPYVGTTLSGASYSIKKIFYRVPGDARKISYLKEFTEPSMIKDIGQPVLDEKFPEYNLTGTPMFFSVVGIYGKEGTYSSLKPGGTISATDGSRTITGSGTTFLSDILPGDKFEISGDTNDYTVESVESDTSLTLYQRIGADAAAGTPYTITENPDSVVIQLYPAADSYTQFPIHYYHYMFDLLEDDDEDEFTRRYPELVVEGAIIWEKRASDDNNWKTDDQRFRMSISEEAGSQKQPGIWIPNITRYNP